MACLVRRQSSLAAAGLRLPARRGLPCRPGAAASAPQSRRGGDSYVTLDALHLDLLVAIAAGGLAVFWLLCSRRDSRGRVAMSRDVIPCGPGTLCGRW
jgi:hypothetical protein